MVILTAQVLLFTQKRTTVRTFSRSTAYFKMVSVFCLRPSISCGRKYEILKIERIKAITVIVDSASRVLLLPQDVEYQRLETTSAVYIVNISGLNDPLIFYKIFSTCLYRFFQLQLILFCY